MSRSLKLDLQPGDYIVWKDDKEPLLKEGMVGRVLKASDNSMAAELAVLIGVPSLPNAEWALVRFENGHEVLVNRYYRFEKIKQH